MIKSSEKGEAILDCSGGRHHGGGVSDRTPGLQGSGQDWEEHLKLRNGVSQGCRESSAWAHWVDVGWVVVHVGESQEMRWECWAGTDV